MALKRAGVTLVAENYRQYIQQLQQIDAVQRQVFSGQRMSQAVSQQGALMRRLGGATTDYKKSVESTAQVVSNLRNKLTDAGQEIQKQPTFLQRATNALNMFKGGWVAITAKLAAAMVVINQVKQKIQYLIKAMDLAAREETLAGTLQLIGEKAGYTTEQVSGAVEVLKNTGITTLAAEKALIRMSRANIKWSEASKLARIAQDSAVVAGMNSSEAFERLVLGIQKMEPELLDELGITLQRSNAYKEFAASIGTTMDKLTTAQKQQAILNEIYRQSEQVAGSYEGAMDTAGKKQASLARYVEETQLSIGRMLLPLRSASVNMQTSFWKGAQAATLGLESFGAAIDIAIKGLGAVQDEMDDTTDSLEDQRTAWEKLGETVFEFGKSAAIAIAKTNARLSVEQREVLEEQRRAEEANQVLREQGWVAYLQKIAEVYDQNAQAREERAAKVAEAEAAAVEKVLESYDILTKSYDEIQQDVSNLDLTPAGGDELDEAAQAAAELAAELEKLIPIYEKLETIQERFDEGSQRLVLEAMKADSEIRNRYAEGQKKAGEQYEKARTQLLDDGNKQREKLIANFNKQQERQQEASLKRQQDAYERHLLSMAQAERRFQVQDRRLRAEGDVLALMQLREDFDLQQKETQENFALDEKQQADAAKVQAQQSQADLEERLRELDTALVERREALKTSYEEEMANLKTAFDEQLAEQDRRNREAYEKLVESRNEEIEELGKSLAKEKEITEEGMNQIAEEISKVFGEDAAGDALIKGWTERTASEFGQLIAEIEAEINALADGMGNATQKLRQQAGPTRFGLQPGLTPFPQATPMREGGVLTGPAYAYIEPGQREAFLPLPAQSTLNVQMSGGFNIQGGDTAGKAAVEVALNRMTEDFAVAIKQLARRR